MIDKLTISGGRISIFDADPVWAFTTTYMYNKFPVFNSSEFKCQKCANAEVYRKKLLAMSENPVLFIRYSRPPKTSAKIFNPPVNSGQAVYFHMLQVG